MTHLDGAAEMFGWWTASDLFEFQDDVAMPTAPFSSGYGLLSVRGAPKPAFHALRFLSLMTGDLMETTLPPGCPRHAKALAVNFPDRVRLLVWNHQSNATMEQGTWNARIRVRLQENRIASGEVQQIVLHVRPGQGAAYETWLEMGRPQNLTRAEEEVLRLAAEPAVSVRRLEIRDGVAEFALELGRCEFAFVELSLPGQPSKERAEERAQDALNDLLSYRQPAQQSSMPLSQKFSNI
jgi:xylan 1,4-beta-xylosidase